MHICICSNKRSNLRQFTLWNSRPKSIGLWLILCFSCHFLIFVNPRYKKIHIYHHHLYHDIIHIHLYHTSLISRYYSYSLISHITISYTYTVTIYVHIYRTFNLLPIRVSLAMLSNHD